MKIDLTGKRAFVTGSSGGIGRAIAIGLAEAGADVAVHYNRNEEGARETLRRIGGRKRDILLGGDVSALATVEGWFGKIKQEWGGLDIFINNAGMDGEKQTLAESETEAWEKVISVNLLGGYYGIRQALKLMLPERSGVIISVTSVHELIPWAGQSAYCASKAAISMLSKSLALEVSDKGIRVLCLAPGAIRTDMNKDVWSDGEMLADLKTKIPMDRIGETEEIANLAVALASEKVGGYMTGTTVFADGGMITYPSFAKGG
jgi:NAD(P)-dependent dehydrogenase (short-subunit alcohol dehydrogenase family)